MKKIFKNNKVIIGLVVFAVVLIALKVGGFNPFTDNRFGHFEKLPDMNFPHAYHKTFLLKDGRVFINGGSLDSIRTPSKSSEIFIINGNN